MVDRRHPHSTTVTPLFVSDEGFAARSHGAYRIIRTNGETAVLSAKRGGLCIRLTCPSTPSVVLSGMVLLADGHIRCFSVGFPYLFTLLFSFRFLIVVILAALVVSVQKKTTRNESRGFLVGIPCIGPFGTILIFSREQDARIRIVNSDPIVVTVGNGHPRLPVVNIVSPQGLPA